MCSEWPLSCKTDHAGNLIMILFWLFSLSRHCHYLHARASSPHLYGSEEENSKVISTEGKGRDEINKLMSKKSYKLQLILWDAFNFNSLSFLPSPPLSISKNVDMFCRKVKKFNQYRNWIIYAYRRVINKPSIAVRESRRKILSRTTHWSLSACLLISISSSLLFIETSLKVMRSIQLEYILVLSTTISCLLL